MWEREKQGGVQQLGTELGMWSLPTVLCRVWSWGWGVHGQLGLRSVDDRAVPTHSNLLDNKQVSFIAAGYGHSAILTAEVSWIMSVQTLDYCPFLLSREKYTPLVMVSFPTLLGIVPVQLYKHQFCVLVNKALVFVQECMGSWDMATLTSSPHPRWWRLSLNTLSIYWPVETSTRYGSIAYQYKSVYLLACGNVPLNMLRLECTHHKLFHW